MKGRHWYTVILLYPDYLTTDYGADLYVEVGLAADGYEAAKIVQGKAVAAQADNSKAGSCDTCDPDDFRVIAVLRGKVAMELDASNF